MIKHLSESLYFAREHLGAFFRIIGPFIVVMAPVTALTEVMSKEFNGLYVPYLLLFTCGQAYFMCRLIKYMASVVTGNKVDLSVSFTEWYNLLLVYVVYTIAVLIGLVALIIPGIFIAAKYGFAEFESVLNQREPFKALSTSWNQTKGIVVTLMLGGALINGCAIVLDIPLDIISEISSTHKFVASCLSSIISSVSMVLVSVFYFRLYVIALEEPKVEPSH